MKKIKTKIRAGKKPGSSVNHNGVKIRSKVRGGIMVNHNGLKVRSKVRAGKKAGG